MMMFAVIDADVLFSNANVMKIKQTAGGNQMEKEIRYAFYMRKLHFSFLTTCFRPTESIERLNRVRFNIIDMANFWQTFWTFNPTNFFEDGEVTNRAGSQ